MDNQQALKPVTESRALRDSVPPSKEGRPVINYATNNRLNFAIQAQLVEAIQKAKTTGGIAGLRNIVDNRRQFTGHPAPVAQLAHERPPNPYNHLGDETQQTAHHILSDKVIAAIIDYVPSTSLPELSRAAITAKALRPFETLTLHQLIDATTGKTAIAEVTLILNYSNRVLTDDCVQKPGKNKPIIWYIDRLVSEPHFQELTGNDTLYQLDPYTFDESQRPPKKTEEDPDVHQPLDTGSTASPEISEIKMISPSASYLTASMLATPPSAKNIEDFHRIYYDYQAIQAGNQPDETLVTRSHPLVQQLLESLSEWNAGNLFIGPRSEKRVEAGSKYDIDIDFTDLAENQLIPGTSLLIHQQLLLARSITKQYIKASRLTALNQKDAQFLELKKQLKAYYTLLAQIPRNEPVAENQSDYFIPTIRRDSNPDQALRFHINVDPRGQSAIKPSLLNRSQIQDILNLRIRLLKPSQIAKTIQDASPLKEQKALKGIEAQSKKKIEALQKKYPTSDPTKQEQYKAELSVIENEKTEAIKSFKQKQQNAARNLIISELLKGMRTGRHDNLMDDATLTSGKYLTRGALENIAIVHALKNAEEMQTSNPDYTNTHQLAQDLLTAKTNEFKKTIQDIDLAFKCLQDYYQNHQNKIDKLLTTVKCPDNWRNPKFLTDLTSLMSQLSEQMYLLSNQMNNYVGYLAKGQNEKENFDHYIHTPSSTPEDQKKPMRIFIKDLYTQFQKPIPGYDATHTSEIWLLQTLEIKAGCREKEAFIQLLDFLLSEKKYLSKEEKRLLNEVKPLLSPDEETAVFKTEGVDREEIERLAGLKSELKPLKTNLQEVWDKQAWTDKEMDRIHSDIDNLTNRDLQSLDFLSTLGGA